MTCREAEAPELIWLHKLEEGFP